MGRNNRQRRAAKARARTRNRPGPGGSSRSGSYNGDGGARTPAELFITAVYAVRGGDDLAARLLIKELADRPQAQTAVAVAAQLEQRVARAWEEGWQPADLGRFIARNLGRLEVTLARWVIAAQAATYAELGARVAPGWMAQLDDIEAVRSWDGEQPYLLLLDGSYDEMLGGAVRLMALLYDLPVLPRLTAPPSAWREDDALAGVSLPPRMLSKVRALLAKAEATTFEAEAETFTAKAQELMARYRIDRAVLDASDDEHASEPVGRRIGIDDPYADAKATLLAGIAGANGCRSIWSKGLGFATTFGFEDELNAVEELFTSLLVQATGALQREGSKTDYLGRSRTTRFRRSFLVAFAIRITQRLQQTVDATIEEVSSAAGTALVPILAAREDATAAAAQAAFPDLRSFAPSATDAEGWHSGTRFGDQANLTVSPRLPAG